MSVDQVSDIPEFVVYLNSFFYLSVVNKKPPCTFVSKFKYDILYLTLLN